MLKRRRDPAAVNSRLIRRPIQRMFWLFLLPMTGAFCIGFVYPFLKGLFLSFCKFKTTSKWTWVGLANYGKAFADESAKTAPNDFLLGAIRSRLEALAGEITTAPSYVAFAEAQDKVSAILAEVNETIMAEVTGEDHHHDCSHDCSCCSGCH